jgi:hypothetical protein
MTILIRAAATLPRPGRGTPFGNRAALSSLTSKASTCYKPAAKRNERGTMLRKLISLIWLVIVIIAIVDIVRSPLATGKKVLWIVLVIVAPVIGVILYYLLGKRT